MTRVTLLFAVVLLATGCPSFGDDLPCDSDRECFNGQRCDLSRGLCAWIDGGTPEEDGGTPDEDGGTPDEDGGTPDEDGGTPDEDGGTPDEDGGTPDEDGGTPDEDGGTPDEDGGVDAGPVDTRCELPPCSPMPDSTAGLCSDGGAVGACPPPSDPWYGQDGEWSVFPPDLIDLENGAIEDRVSGLVWMASPLPELKTAVQAEQACEALDHAGRNDWRLPTHRELFTLMDLNHEKGAPTTDTWFFHVPDPAKAYWTADRYPGSSASHMVVLFNGSLEETGGDGSYLQVRCVGGAAPVAGEFRFSRESLIDRHTGLTWYAKGPSPSLPLLSALAFCNDLDHAGFTDWRLPSLKELYTIVDFTSSWPATYPDLGGLLEDGEYWTSTPYVTSPPNGFYTVELKYGELMTQGAASDAYVICARGGEVSP